MTAIQHFPEELLFLIFKDLEELDLMECQVVCRAWYPPAHVLLLDDTGLYKRKNIEQFIESFDINPDPKYVNAVRRLDIAEVDDFDPDYRLNITILKKLFFRFPKLQVVDMTDSFGLLQNFNNRLCKTILENCPNLDSFALRTHQHKSIQYCNTLRKVRLLVTTIDLNELGPISNIPQFLTMFPRLQTISGNSTQLNNFEVFLPILEHVPGLSNLGLQQTGDDKQNLMEKYTAAKSNDERNKLTQRLAGINKLDWDCKNRICSASIKFVAQYLTGLSSVRMQNYLGWELSDSVISEFYSFVLRLLDTVDQCNILLNLRGNDSLQSIVPRLFKKSALNKSLELTLVDDFSSNAENIHIKTDRKKSTQHVDIIMSDEEISYSLNTVFKCDSPVENVDQFILTVGERHIHSTFKSKIYDDVLEGISSSLKKITLDVPKNILEVDGCPSIKRPHMEALTIQASPNGRFQKLLDGWAISFPQLQELEFSFWSGVWKESIDEFQVELGKYSLQKLTVDTTPVKMKMIEKKLPLENGFFVVLVHVLQSNQRHMFKVALNLSSATRIDDKDLDGFVRGENYHRVNVTIRSLQGLQLKMYKSSKVDIVDEYYFEKNYFWEKNFTRLTLLAKGE